MSESKHYIYTMDTFFDNIDYLYNNKHDGLLDIKIGQDNSPTVYENHTEYKLFYSVKYKTFSTCFCKQNGWVYEEIYSDLVEEMKAYVKTEVRRMKIEKILL